MTDIWKLPNGNYARRRDGCAFVVYSPGEWGVADFIDTVPADAVPMVPATGRQVTGQELHEAQWQDSSWTYCDQYTRDKWNKAAERLNLRVRELEPRQPWDVLREAADILADEEWASTARILHFQADESEREAATTLQRDREIDKAIKAYFDAAHGGVPATVHKHVRKGMAAVLDAVRGEQA